MSASGAPPTWRKIGSPSSWVPQTAPPVVVPVVPLDDGLGLGLGCPHPGGGVAPGLCEAGGHAFPVEFPVPFPVPLPVPFPVPLPVVRWSLHTRVCMFGPPYGGG